ncbi:ribonuclease HII [Meiothermus cerbereus]|uniref:ribonuclease HII n=1 Tax=Meiothermus cerbereus TaxID=65552 RepID=UPI003EEDD7B2
MPALESDWWRMGLRVAGVDEAGRGALAGPVVAAAVILPPPQDQTQYPFQDSKTLSARLRDQMADQIRVVALAWGVGWAGVAEIDRLGILKATHLAAARALAQLAVPAEALLTDYLRLEREWRQYLHNNPPRPDSPGLLRCPPKADQNSPTVAAASILAKVARDRYMEGLEQRYPGYGFAQHKGYGTALHLQALDKLGPCEEHRRTFAPVAQTGLF